MVEVTFALLVKYEPGLGLAVKEKVDQFHHLIREISNWQEEALVVTLALFNWPDTDDEARINSFDYRVKELINGLESIGASVDERKKAA